jgi:hypothetical protein
MQGGGVELESAECRMHHDVSPSYLCKRSERNQDC